MVQDNIKLAVVIPCYKVKSFILDVISGIGSEVSHIYVIDDCCPELTGAHVEQYNQDTRVSVLYNPVNLGVGGATLHGYSEALKNGSDIIIKLDGDGQMDASLIPLLIQPIIEGDADYTKGNRFYSPEHIANMPPVRLLGNAVLSLFIKVSSGYWNIFDPNNGFTAIHKSALALLPLHKINNGYFFESDMLFRLNTIRAVVIDTPMKAIYGSETSNLQTHKQLIPFFSGHCKNFIKRVGYNYFLRDLNIASLELIFGLCFLLFGLIYGGYNWFQYASSSTFAPGGVIMLSAISIILSIQLLLSAINYDIQNIPRIPLQKYYSNL